MKEKYPQLVQDVRGWGLIRGVQISDDSNVKSLDIVQACIDKGLLLVPAGPKVVRFVPPLVVTEEQVDYAVRTFEKGLITVAALHGKTEDG